MVLCGISTSFDVLFPTEGQVAHALLTRPPLKLAKIHPKASFDKSPLDLHVLGTPPAFVLSQNQTLMFNFWIALDRFSIEYEFHSKFLTVVLAFLCLYRFQGSVLSSELVYNTTGRGECQHFFYEFFKVISYMVQTLIQQGLQPSVHPRNHPFAGRFFRFLSKSF